MSDSTRLLMRILERFSIVVFCLCIVGCSSKEEELALQYQVDAAKERGEEIQAKIGKAYEEKNSLLEEIEKLKRLARYGDRNLKEASEANDMLREAEAYKTRLEQAIGFYEERIGLWKVAARNSLVGRQIGPVRLSDNRVLEAGFVAEIDDDGITVGGPAGESRYSFDLLPKDLRAALGDESVFIDDFNLSKP